MDPFHGAASHPKMIQMMASQNAAPTTITQNSVDSFMISPSGVR